MAETKGDSILMVIFALPFVLLGFVCGVLARGFCGGFYCRKYKCECPEPEDAAPMPICETCGKTEGAGEHSDDYLKMHTFRPAGARVAGINEQRMDELDLPRWPVAQSGAGGEPPIEHLPCPHFHLRDGYWVLCCPEIAELKDCDAKVNICGTPMPYADTLATSVRVAEPAAGQGAEPLSDAELYDLAVNSEVLIPGVSQVTPTLKQLRKFALDLKAKLEAAEPVTWS